jgi:sarcosine oxidase subunit alpha
VKTTDIAIVGGGPAGMCAAIEAAGLGARVTLIDDGLRLGGQLVKQTHKFFGSKSHYCGTRGMDIAAIFADQLSKTSAEALLGTSVVGAFAGRVLGLASADRFTKLRYERLIVATGAAENNLLFAGNDLPGVYGAGAVQTLMNVYGVRPGRRALMVGSGNIGLIVAYQMIQAGIEVAAVVEALPHIGGYHVHAAKVARLGVPILTSHTIVAAFGTSRVTGAVTCKVGRGFQPKPGTNRRLTVDTICLAVGLTPLSEILWQLGCQMVCVPELGGNVAWHNESMETSVPGVYVAGDVSGIEEASTAMLEGRVAGAHAARSVLGPTCRCDDRLADARAELCAIRQGPFGDKAACGKQKLAECRSPSSS